MTNLTTYYAAQIKQRPKNPLGQFFEDGDGNTIEAYKDKKVKSTYLKDEEPEASKNGPIAEVLSCRKFHPQEEILEQIEKCKNLEELKERIRENE